MFLLNSIESRLTATMEAKSDLSNTTLEQLKELEWKLTEQKRVYEKWSTQLLASEKKRKKRSLLTYLLNPDQERNACGGSEPDITTGHVLATRTHELVSSVLLRDFSLNLTHDTLLAPRGNSRLHPLGARWRRVFLVCSLADIKRVLQVRLPRESKNPKEKLFTGSVNVHVLVRSLRSGSACLLRNAISPLDLL
jgi:hypothetical protein